MNSLKRMEEIQKILQDKQEEKLMTQGQFNSAMDRLKELGFTSVVSAEKEISNLQEKVESIEAEIEAEVKALEEKYSELLVD